MKYLKTICLSVLTFTATSAFAATCPLSEAQKIASKTLTNSQLVTLSHVKISSADTLYYVYTGNVGGYAIVSANSQAVPLLGYSKEGTLDNLPEPLRLMLDGAASNTDLLHTSSASGSRLKATRIANKAIKPLLGVIEWGQREPFFNKTPLLSGEHTLTGCVATAMAQIMAYYRYPSEVKAEIPAYTTKTKEIDVAAVKKGTVIDWDNIPDNFADGYSDAEANAVANLLSILGTAASMDYNLENSGASCSVPSVLIDYFGYDKELVRKVFRSSYSFADWSNLVYNELLEKRPVYFSGQSMASGHAFVCDGIDDNGLFHINWGWDGVSNGYFDLALLNPNNTTGAGASKTNDGYSGDNYIVCGIMPDNGVRDEVADGPTTIAKSVKLQASGDSYCLFFSFSNANDFDTTVVLANGFIDDGGNVVKVANIGSTDMESLGNYKLSSAYPISTKNFVEGKKYKVGMVESTDGVNFVPCAGFENVSYTFILKDGKLLVADSYELSAVPEITNFNYVGQYAHGIIHFKNSGEKEYYDKFYLFTNTVDEMSSGYSYAATITAEAGQTNDVDFKFVAKADTMYYWITDVDLNVLKQGYWVKGQQQYNLTASARVDTLSNGDLAWVLYIENQGDAYYDNDVRINFFYDGGYITITSRVFLKGGESLTRTGTFEKQYEYTKYGVYDYNSDQVAYGALGEYILPDEVTYNLSVDKYQKVGQTLQAVLSVTNNTDEDYNEDFFFAIDTQKTFKGEVFDTINVSVKAKESESFPFSFVATRDSFYLVYYASGSSSRRALFLKAAEVSTFVYNVQSHNVLDLSAEPSMLVAEATAPVVLTVVNASGKLVATKRLKQAGVCRIPLPSGVYIVNGKKILIR